MGSGSVIRLHGAVLDTTVLDKITAELEPKAAVIVEKYGTAIMGDAVSRAPVDTGALMNSITTASKMTGKLTYTMSDGVEYGVYQEFGTSKMGAHPFMRPAIEAWAQRFQDAFRSLFS